MGRLVLFTKCKAVNMGMIRAGHYGIRESNDTIVDLGKRIDVIPFARRPMAVDQSDPETVVKCYDVRSPEFARIAAAPDCNSHCMYGPSYLVFERTTARFHEFYCGAKSSRAAAKEIAPYLPLTEADIRYRKLTDVQPRGPVAVTLTSRVEKSGRGRWHIPVVAGAAKPFENLPDVAVIVETILKFMRVALP